MRWSVRLQVRQYASSNRHYRLVVRREWLLRPASASDLHTLCVHVRMLLCAVCVPCRLLCQAGNGSCSDLIGKLGKNSPPGPRLAQAEVTSIQSPHESGRGELYAGDGWRVTRSRKRRPCLRLCLVEDRIQGWSERLCARASLLLPCRQLRRSSSCNPCCHTRGRGW